MSEEDPQDAPEQDSIMAEASMWFGRMRGPEAEKHKAEFEAWLARGALHRAFYNRAGEVYAMGKFLKEEAERRDDPGEEDRAPDGPPPQETRRRPLLWFAGGGFAVLCIVIALSAAIVPGYLRNNGPGTEIAGRSITSGKALRLETRDGQVLTQTLPDGSIVKLEPDSLLLVAYDETDRALYLQKGKSRFEVAHEGRPFVVHAGKGSVTARGTIFEVTLLASQRVAVHLVRGSVDVALESSDPRQNSVRRLQAGEMIVLSQTSIGTPVVPSPVAASPPASDVAALPQASASDRMEEFSETPLGELVASANRRGGIQIQLASPDLAALKVSGRFRLNDPAALARKLALIFGLDLDQANAGVIVLKHR